MYLRRIKKNPKKNKEKENYSKANYIQIAIKEWERENLKCSHQKKKRKKKGHFVQKNKDKNNRILIRGL